jgi:hypothetical protein
VNASAQMSELKPAGRSEHCQSLCFQTLALCPSQGLCVERERPGDLDKGDMGEGTKQQVTILGQPEGLRAGGP